MNPAARWRASKRIKLSVKTESQKADKIPASIKLGEGMGRLWSTSILAMLLPLHSSCYSESEAHKTPHQSAITSSQDHLSKEIPAATTDSAQSYQSALRASRAYLDGESRQIIDLLLTDGEILTPQSSVMHEAMKGSTVYLRLASTQTPEDLDRQIYGITEIIAIPGENSWIKSWTRSDTLKFFSPVPINFELAAQVYLRTEILFVAQTTDNGLKNMFDSAATKAFLLQTEKNETTTTLGGQPSSYSPTTPDGLEVQSNPSPSSSTEVPAAVAPCRETGDSCQGVCRDSVEPIQCCEAHLGPDAEASCVTRFLIHCYNQALTSVHPLCSDVSSKPWTPIVSPPATPPVATLSPAATPMCPDGQSWDESTGSCMQTINEPVCKLDETPCHGSCCSAGTTCTGFRSFPCKNSWGIVTFPRRPHCSLGKWSCRPLLGVTQCCQAKELCGWEGCYSNPSDNMQFLNETL